MSIVIIYGPQGAKKTRRSEKLKKVFGCTNIVDGWDGQTRLKEGDLAITNERPPFSVPGAKVVSLHEAKNKAIRSE